MSWPHFSSLLGHANLHATTSFLVWFVGFFLLACFFFFCCKNLTNFKITTILEATYKHVFIASSLGAAKITIPLNTHIGGRSHFLHHSHFPSKSPQKLSSPRRSLAHATNYEFFSDLKSEPKSCTIPTVLYKPCKESF